MMMFRFFVEIRAAHRAQSFAIRAAQRASGLVEQDVFAQKRLQIEMRVFGDGQKRVGGILRRIHKEVFEMNGDRCGEGFKAAGALGGKPGGKITHGDDTLRSPRQ